MPNRRGRAPIAWLAVAKTSSSTKKAAKLAQHGSSRAVRFQGGTVFPLAIALTLVLGLALIVYARQTRPAADSSPPTINDHWHATYGFYLCDQWFELSGNLEEVNSQGGLINTRFLASGVHSHDDGVIHWHPYGSTAVGRRAILKVFFDSYGVELSNDELKFPDNNIPPTGLQEYIEGETKCDGEDAELSVKVWDLYTDVEADSTYIADMDQIHIDNDGMVFGIYFTARDADRPKPPKAEQLQELGAADTGAGAFDPADLVSSDGSTPLTLPGTDSTTVPDDTTDTTEVDGTDTTVADTGTTVAETATTTGG